MKPVLSIVTVCYNSATTIGRTFESVLEQDVDEMEYVVIDGESDDTTMEVIENYRKKFAKKGIEMVVVSEPDGGIYDAMNKGISLSRGEIVGIINSDDYYEPQILKKVLSKFLKKSEVSIIYGFMRYLDRNQEIKIARNNFDYIFSSRNKIENFSGAGHPTCFVKKKLYDDIGVFDINFRTAADLDFLLRAAKSGIKFLAVDFIVTNFSVGGVSNSISDQELAEQKVQILFKNGIISRCSYDSYLSLLKRRKLKMKLKWIIKKFLRSA